MMAKWIDKMASKNLKNVRCLCPNDLFGSVAPKVCYDTVFYSKTDYRVAGCRKITCEECWNKEEE